MYENNFDVFVIDQNTFVFLNVKKKNNQRKRIICEINARYFISVIRL